MSGHLSSEQISRWATGERDQAEEAHVSECSHCRAEVECLESVLAQFGSSVRQCGERHMGVPVFRPTAAPPHRLGRWVLATAAILVLVMVPAYESSRERRRAAEQAAADALLMERVDRAVSRTAPRPMEPLEELMAGTPGYAEGK